MFQFKLYEPENQKHFYISWLEKMLSPRYLLVKSFFLIFRGSGSAFLIKHRCAKRGICSGNYMRGCLPVSPSHSDAVSILQNILSKCFYLI